MNQYDVFDVSKRKDRSELFIVLQAIALNDLSSVIVAPLAKLGRHKPIAIINPQINIFEETYFIRTDRLASVRVTLLKAKVAAVEDAHYDVSKALDRLFSGI